MRIAVLIYPMSNPERLTLLAKSFIAGLQGQGHLVEMFNIRTDANIRLGVYDYLCFGSQGGSLLSGRIDPALTKQLDGLSGCSGKRSFAFIGKKAFFSESVLKGLMKAMESQGLFIRNSAIFATADEARLLGSTLEVARKG